MMIDESLMIRVDDNDVDVSVDKRMHDIMEMKAMVLMLMTIMDYTHSTCIPSQTLVGGDDDENRTGVSDDEVNQIGKDNMIAVNQNKKTISTHLPEAELWSNIPAHSIQARLLQGRVGFCTMYIWMMIMRRMTGVLELPSKGINFKPALK